MALNDETVYLSLTRYHVKSHTGLMSFRHIISDEAVGFQPFLRQESPQIGNFQVTNNRKWQTYCTLICESNSGSDKPKCWIQYSTNQHFITPLSQIGRVIHMFCAINSVSWPISGHQSRGRTGFICKQN